MSILCSSGGQNKLGQHIVYWTVISAKEKKMRQARAVGSVEGKKVK